MARRAPAPRPPSARSRQAAKATLARPAAASASAAGSKPARGTASSKPPRPRGAATAPATPAASEPTRPPQPAGASPLPDVIVDFHVENGLLFVVLHNVGSASAFQVATSFDHAFRGLGGQKEVTRLAMFREVPFLAPGKRLSQLVDTAHAFFKRQEPRRLRATVTFRDRDGRRYKNVLPHDLDIYRELAAAVLA